MTNVIDNFTGSYGWLSNFYRGDPFYLPGWQKLMPTAEHAFQACKAMTGEQAHWVLEASSPQLAKSRGRQVQAHPDWDKRKKRIMLKILLAKFADEQLAGQLIATGDASLVEGNTWGDDYWGAVQRERGAISPYAAIWAPSGEAGDLWWAGHNWLGRELMMVRMVLGGD